MALPLPGYPSFAPPPTVDGVADMQPTAAARLLAYLLAAAALVTAGYLFVQQWRQILDLRPVELHLWARVAEDGGWQADTLRIPSGHGVHLTVYGVSGAHTFALAQTDVALTQLLQPGDEATLDFVAPAPGRYILYCTTWCSLNHWRMRTVVEVYDPQDADAPLTYAQTPPRYTVKVAPHMLDMPHPGPVWPTAKPDAAAGAAHYPADGLPPAAALAALDWPNATPADAYAWLQAGNLGGGEAAGTPTAQAAWDRVAYLWQQGSTPAERARGQALYQQDCAACHGDQGQGNGFGAAGSPAQEPDWTNLELAAGASPALYYAKIARGGMGTGMPNWGTLLAEDDLWALVAYLQTFTYTPIPDPAPAE